MVNEAEYKHLLGKVLDAERGGQVSWACQSTGEKLAVALVLNKPEWIKEMGYTLAEAVDRVGPEWCALLLRAQWGLGRLREEGHCEALG